MKDDVSKSVLQCLVCQQAKLHNMSPIGLLQLLTMPTQIWEDIAMDFIIGLPNSFGFTIIMVVVDWLLKYGHFVALKIYYNSRSVVEVFMEHIVKLHGLPKSIVSDRAKVFNSQFWQHLFKLKGTSLIMSSAYHPQTNGQSKVLNKY